MSMLQSLFLFCMWGSSALRELCLRLQQSNEETTTVHAARDEPVPAIRMLFDRSRDLDFNDLNLTSSDFVCDALIHVRPKIG